jgi:hypothetical protein
MDRRKKANWRVFANFDCERANISIIIQQQKNTKLERTKALVGDPES